MNFPPEKLGKPLAAGQEFAQQPMRLAISMLDLLMQGRFVARGIQVDSARQLFDQPSAALKSIDGAHKLGPHNMPDNPQFAALKMMRYVLAAAGEFTPEDVVVEPKRPFVFNAFNPFDKIMKDELDMMLKNHDVEIPEDPTQDFVSPIPSSKIRNSNAQIQRSSTKFTPEDMQGVFGDQIDPLDTYLAGILKNGLTSRYQYDVFRYDYVPDPIPSDRA